MKRISILALFGLTLFSCVEDPTDFCEGVVCNNGGACFDGLCECPDAWTGPSCDVEVVPEKMIVNRIKLTNFPLFDPGALPWDPTDAPDVYIVIRKNGVKLFETLTVQNLATENDWTVSFDFPDPTGDYLFQVWDDDFGVTPDDLIGEVTSPLYMQGFGFPTSFFINCEGCVVELQLNEVVYVH